MSLHRVSIYFWNAEIPDIVSGSKEMSVTLLTKELSLLVSEICRNETSDRLLEFQQHL